MSILRRQPLLVVVAVLALAWLALSPYIVLWQISNAVKSGDVDALSSLVDFPAVRESVKGSMMAAVTKSMADSSKSSSGAGAFGAGLGMLLAGPMVNTMVDGIVTPQGISNLIKTGKIPNPTQAASFQESSTEPSPSPHFDLHYVSFDRFAVNIAPVGQPTLLEGRLCRVSVLGWKLCSVAIDVPTSDT